MGSDRDEWIEREAMLGVADQAAPAAELKPCPFCGGEAELGQSYIPREHASRIICLACGIHIIRTDPWSKSGACRRSIAAWNARAAPPFPDAEARASLVAKLRDAAQTEEIARLTREHEAYRARSLTEWAEECVRAGEAERQRDLAVAALAPFALAIKPDVPDDDAIETVAWTAGEHRAACAAIEEIDDARD